MWFKFSYCLLNQAPCRSGKLPAELLLSTVTPCSWSTLFPGGADSRVLNLWWRLGRPIWFQMAVECRQGGAAGEVITLP